MKNKVTVKIKRLDPRAKVPTKGSADAAGWDLYALEGGYIHRGMIQQVRTGVALELPRGYEAQVRPRSGLATRYGVAPVNTPGTVDADYRGEVKVCLVNHGQGDYSWNPGERLAQLVIQRVPVVELIEADELDETDRGAGGFGSTGR